MPILSKQYRQSLNASGLQNLINQREEFLPTENAILYGSTNGKNMAETLLFNIFKPLIDLIFPQEHQQEIRLFRLFTFIMPLMLSLQFEAPSWPVM